MGQQRLIIVMAAVIIGLLIYIAVRGGGAKTATIADAGVDALSTTGAVASNKAADSLGDAGDLGLDRLSDLGSPSLERTNAGADGGGVGTRLPDGNAVPALPEKSPRAVHFGVVLVTYAGASQAPANARSKKDAEELARKLAADAKSDFHAAVGRGDSGSADDLGRMPRGMLEAGIEYALFTLSPGQVSDPVDTPRGFWIMKRID